MPEDQGAELSVGDRVFYVAHDCHALDFDRDMRRVFRFEFARPKERGAPRFEGPVTDWVRLGRIEAQEPDGTFRTASGAVIRPAGPVAPWPAEVVEQDLDLDMKEATAVVDGTEQRVFYRDSAKRLALEIRHPNGCVTLYYPLEGDGAVAHDPSGQKSHSYHREGEHGP